MDEDEFVRGGKAGGGSRFGAGLEARAEAIKDGGI